MIHRLVSQLCGRNLLPALILGLAVLLSPVLASAQPYKVYENGVERENAARRISAISLDTAFGDKISTFNGAVEFNHVDISIPGNSELPVELRRSLNIDDRSRGDTKHFSGFRDWDLDIPYLESVVSQNYGWRPTTNAASVNQRCSLPGMLPSIGNVDTDDYSDGYNLHIPGQGTMSMLMFPSTTLPSPTDGNTYPWNTKEQWRIRCKSSTKNGYPGEAFIAVSPSGLTYYLDWVVVRPYTPLDDPWGSFAIQRNVVFFLVSRIEDRFGNSVDYTYSGEQLTGISANDGRYITPTWTGTQITSAASSAGTWSYTYVPDRLNTVVQPDGSHWQFTATGSMQMTPPSWNPIWEDPTGCPDSLDPPGGSYGLTVKAPSGATAQYGFDVLQHLRSSIPEHACVIVSTTLWYWKTPKSYYSFTLTSKNVTGPGVAPLSTQYSYGGPYPMLDDDKENSTLDSDGTLTVYTYGTGWAINEGQLLRTQTGTTTGFLREVGNEYVSSASGHPFPDYAGQYPGNWGEPVATMLLRPLKQRTTDQQAASFVWKATAYDVFARPTTVQRVSSGITSDRSRTDVTVYSDNTSKWVLGQTASVTNSDTGLVVQNTTFDAQALPIDTYRFGKKQSTSAWNPDGTLASITDGRGNAIGLSNWKRGIPQTVTFPATAESPAGSSKTYTVNDAGWITQTTDENGFAHNFAHDAMGRTSQINYPAGDSVAWTPTNISYQSIGSTEYGLPAGHWKRTETTGNQTNIVYLDGLWRPVVTETYDAGNVAATRSIQVNRFDEQGRQTFASYPVDSLVIYTDSLGGVTTTHDHLDRPTAQTQTSELGNLVTTTQYLSGLQTQVTDPRSAVTLTKLTAWDDPDESMPAQIVMPEDRITDFARDALGDVTALTRRNGANTVSLTRSFVRNTHRELCKQIDPESGATVREFDGAGNVQWQASGLNLPSTADCDTAAAYSSGRRIDLSWDARNRLSAQTFPDGLGNTSTTYWPDGAINTQTAYNGAGNTVPVVTSHTYNKRRLPETETSGQPSWYSWTVQRAYDAIANPSTLTYPTGLVVDYHPNALGQPTSVTASDGTTLASGIAFYPNGALKQFTYGNGIVHSMTQNLRQLPARSLDVGVIDDNYTYDANANTTAITDPIAGTAGTRTMTYDLADRLLTASAAVFGGDGVHRTTFDVLDNLKSWKLNGVKDYANYVYDGRNLPTQILNSGAAAVVTQTFDVQGNLSIKDGRSYVFDFGNRLREVPGIEFSRYDGAGRRVLRWPASGSGLLSMYTADNAYLYAENYLPTPSKRFTYVHLQGSQLATLEFDFATGVNAWKYQHTDALGSPVAETNASGAVIDRTNWEPWGKAIGKPAIDNIGFTGHQMDASTGAIYMQQRYYDPYTAQFLSVDPVAVDLSSGNNFNRRVYTRGNPYKFTDFDGRQETIRPEYFQNLGYPRTMEAVKELAITQQENERRRSSEAIAGRLDDASSWLTGASLAISTTPAAPMAVITQGLSETAAILALAIKPSGERALNVAAAGAFGFGKMVVKEASIAGKSIERLETVKDANEVVTAAEKRLEMRPAISDGKDQNKKPSGKSK